MLHFFLLLFRHIVCMNVCNFFFFSEIIGTSLLFIVVSCFLFCLVLFAMFDLYFDTSEINEINQSINQKWWLVSRCLRGGWSHGLVVVGLVVVGLVVVGLVVVGLVVSQRGLVSWWLVSRCLKGGWSHGLRGGVRLVLLSRVRPYQGGPSGSCP